MRPWRCALATTASFETMRAMVEEVSASLGAITLLLDAWRGT